MKFVRVISFLVRRSVIIFGLCLLAGFDLQAEHFRHITLSQGLSQPSVMCIEQDRFGRMWFGTREGVNVYDGITVQSYKGWVTDPVTGENVWIGNEVTAMASDSVGNMFMHIDDDIIKYDIVADRFSRFSHCSNVSAMSGSNGIICFIAGDSIFIKEADNDRLHYQYSVPSPGYIRSFCLTPDDFVFSTTAGLYFYDRKTRENTVMLKDANVFSTYYSPKGILWISTDNDGLFRLAPNDKEPVCVSVPKTKNGTLGEEQVRNAIEDRFGRVWYGSFSGLFCYDPSDGKTTHIQIPANLGGLSHSSIFGLYKDRGGTIWAGSYYGGVNYFTPSHDSYFNFDYGRIAPTELFHSVVIDMVSDRDGNLWFGTDGAGVCCVDSMWNVVTQLSTLSGERALRQNNIKSLAYDSEHHRVYIGTHLGGLSYYDIEAGKTVNLIDKMSANELPGNVIHRLHIAEGALYISSRMGISRMDLSDGSIRKIDGSKPLEFDIDDDGNLCFIKNGHLNILKDAGAELVSVGSPDAHIIEWPVSILCTGEGVYVGTLGQGVYMFPKDGSEVCHFTSHNSPLPSDYCYAIAKGADDCIFIATDKKIVKYNPSADTFTAIDFGNYFPGSHIIAECALMTKADGSVFVGSTKGITVLFDEVFNDSNVLAAPDSRDMYFAHLNVGNREIRPNDGSGILDRALPYADEIRLKPGHNSFGLRIALVDYVNTSASQQFQYKLDGVDDDWLTAPDGMIHYTNLTPGDYKLRARRVFADDVTGSEISLKVVVESPWYATRWACLIYALIAIAVVYFIVRKVKDVTRLKLYLRKEKYERQQIEKLNHEKLVFFTNVSHEFQTPLTLILSHIDLMMSKNTRNERLTESLTKVRSHAEQMSHLITQLLEFRKLQQNHQTVRIGRHDAGKLLVTIAEQFRVYAVGRDIRFEVVTPAEPVFGYYDPRLINRVLVNIISNAFKYTPDGGEIVCRVSRSKQGFIEYRVSDTGKGISESDMPFIFDRFYNGSAEDSDHKALDYKSTGIGLAFAKSIVEKHHGFIGAESVEGKGSTFIVELPDTKEPFKSDSNVVFGSDDDYFETDGRTATLKIPDNHEMPDTDCLEEHNDDIDTEEEQTVILIAEDNAELRNNLAVYFSTYYRVIQACDGVDALEKARLHNPDLVISDVMMPNMSGTEMCRTMKTDLALCHIPVILLTALSATGSRLEGLNANADDYVTKPYDSAILLARVDNLLRNRRLLRHQFEKRPVSEIDITVVNPIDRELLKKTSEIIDAHIADASLDIPLICRELGISKSLFYSKFKSLTGMTPSAFILNYRLKHACTLLTAQPHFSVTEVADKTGFSTTAYFSRCFKKQFGVSPQKYRVAESPVSVQ